jgi:hypothetical protein
MLLPKPVVGATLRATAIALMAQATYVGATV